MINILIAEDSPVQQEFMVTLLNSISDFNVIDVAKNGKEAVELALIKKPDIILMDINMPIMNGFEATSRIMETRATPIIIVSSSYEPNEVEKSFKALEAGALMILSKPPGIGHPDHVSATKELIRLIRLMSEVHVITRKNRYNGNSNGESQPVIPKTTNRQFKLVAIGVSTGGPVILQQILSKLPAGFPLPILIVQHISKGFLQGMVEWLDHSIELPVHVAAQNMLLAGGHVYFAPDDYHIGIVNHDSLKVRLWQDTQNSAFCPSVAEMFRSVADSLAPDVIGILLTGMGSDGSRELKYMNDRGCITIAQDEKSSIVFGMPKVAIELGGAQYVLNPCEIVNTLKELTKINDTKKAGDL